MNRIDPSSLPPEIQKLTEGSGKIYKTKTGDFVHKKGLFAGRGLKRATSHDLREFLKQVKQQEGSQDSLKKNYQEGFKVKSAVSQILNLFSSDKGLREEVEKLREEETARCRETIEGTKNNIDDGLNDYRVNAFLCAHEWLHSLPNRSSDENALMEKADELGLKIIGQIIDAQRAAIKTGEKAFEEVNEKPYIQKYGQSKLKAFSGAKKALGLAREIFWENRKKVALERKQAWKQLERISMAGDDFKQKFKEGTLPANPITVKGSLSRLPVSQDRVLPHGLNVEGDLLLDETSWSSLPDGLVVGGKLGLRKSAIDELPMDLEVKGDLVLTSTKIPLLPRGLKVGGDVIFDDGDLHIIEEGVDIGGQISTVGLSEIRKGVSLGGDVSWYKGDLQRGGSDHLLDRYPSLPEGLVIKGNMLLRGLAVELVRDKLPEKDLKVEGNFSVKDMEIASLPKNLKIGGDLQIINCPKLTSLPSGLQINGDLRIDQSSIKILPEDLVVKGEIYLDPSTKVPTGKGFGKKVIFPWYPNVRIRKGPILRNGRLES